MLSLSKTLIILASKWLLLLLMFIRIVVIVADFCIEFGPTTRFAESLTFDLCLLLYYSRAQTTTGSIVVPGKLQLELWLLLR